MMFRKEHGKVNVTSLVERVSRYVAVICNEDWSCPAHVPESQLI